MGLIAWLRAGAHGITFDCPANLVVTGDDDLSSAAVERDTGVSWFFFLFPRVHLDLSPRGAASLRRDVESHSRYLLHSMQTDAGTPPDIPRRPGWSPLIACEEVAVDGSPALFVLHRMVYQPGHELVMGHLLVPLKLGLFEARWITASRSTGMRESLLLARAMAGRLDDPNASAAPAPDVANGSSPGLALKFVQGPSPAPGIDVDHLMRTLDYDDPRFDPEFPQHPLSLARRAGEWLREGAGLRIRAPAPPLAGDMVELSRLGCRLVPPPRFVLDACRRNVAQFHRVSLAGNDGIQHFVVAEARTRAVLEPGRMVEMRMRAMEALAPSAPVLTATSVGAPSPLASAVVFDGAVGSDQVRIVSAWLDVAGMRGVVLLVVTTPAQSPEPLVEELATTATTLQLSRPWWRFW